MALNQNDDTVAVPDQDEVIIHLKNLFKSNVMDYINNYKKEILKTSISVDELGRVNKLLITSTLGVGDVAWETVKSDFGLNKEDFIKINIIPVMKPLLCHINAHFLRSYDHEVKMVYGFNLTSSTEGKFVILELHSVIKYKGVYYDLTTDYNGEKEKFFIPFAEYESESAITSIKSMMIDMGFNGGIICNKNIVKENKPRRIEWKCPTVQNFKNIPGKLNLLNSIVFC